MRCNRLFVSAFQQTGYLINKVLACSKRSDSGERCGVEKAMKSRGGLGREVREPLLLPRFYFFALPFTLHRSPLSERLEQANKVLVLTEFCDFKMAAIKW